MKLPDPASTAVQADPLVIVETAARKGAAGVLLAVARTGTGQLVLVKETPARKATDTKPAREAGWRRTSDLAHFADALAVGLIE